MRPQQQNRRMRGRNNGGGGGGNNSNNNNNNSNNNNRKGPNPLTRNYESNGPDVKIRGSAQQIAEKYSTLARDATSSGDRVMAENYLQHAEHYNRIIASAQAQFAAQQVNPVRDDMDDDMDDSQYSFEGGPNNGADQSHPQQHSNTPHNSQPPVQSFNGSGPQPVIEGMPAEVALNTSAPNQPSGGRQHRERRPNRHPIQNGVFEQPVGETPVTGSSSPDALASQAEPVSQAETIAVPAGTEGNERQAPRRGRRPRRGERDDDQGERGSDASPESSEAVPQSEAGSSSRPGRERPVMEPVDD